MAMDEPMTPERLAEIRTREQAATPGPWIDLVGDIYSQVPTGERDLVHGYVAKAIAIEEDEGDYWGEIEWSRPADYEFVLHSRDDIPALLAEVDRLRDGLRVLKREAFEREYNDPSITNLLYFVGPRVDALIGDDD